jgi:N-acetylneuraminic acid mutarotase
MLLAASHTESSAVVVDATVYLFGGQCALGADSAELGITDAVQRYDAAADRWTLVGTLPYRVKTAAVGRFENWIYAVGGQRDRGPEDARPGSFVNHCWRARFP